MARANVYFQNRELVVVSNIRTVRISVLCYIMVVYVLY